MIVDKETCGLTELELTELEEFGNRLYGGVMWWSLTETIKEIKDYPEIYINVVK